MKNRFLFTLPLLTAGALPAIGAEKASKKSDGRPNLLFIITDQQRFDALGFVGRYPFLKTPNLDRLARNSVQFTRCYTQCAASAPARATIFTGLTVEHHGVATNNAASEDPVKNNITKISTYDQVLAANGYHVEYYGKYHSPIGWSSPYTNFSYTAPLKDPFKYRSNEYERFAAFVQDAIGKPTPSQGELYNKILNACYIPDSIDRSVYERNHYLPDSDRLPFNQPDCSGRLLVPENATLTAFQAGSAIEALERVTRKGKPWSITCSISMPHSPMLPSLPYYGMYPPGDMPVPASIEDPIRDSPYTYTNSSRFLPQYGDRSVIGYMMSCYFALVTEIDLWTGKLLDALEHSGQAGNTLVIFTSDHGEMLGSHGLREKGLFYEESSRVPFLISWPGVIKPGIVERCVSNIDFASTILDYLGIKDSARRDGTSLRDLIEGGDRPDEVITEWLFRGPTQPTHMIIRGNWKLFLSYDPESKLPPVLYNLESDPLEMTNLIGASNPERARYTEKAAELRDGLVKWLSACGSKYANMIQTINFQL